MSNRVNTSINEGLFLGGSGTVSPPSIVGLTEDDGVTELMEDDGTTVLTED